MKIGLKRVELDRHSGKAKRDPESRPRLSFKSPGYRIRSGMTAKDKGLKAVLLSCEKNGHPRPADRE